MRCAYLGPLCLVGRCLTAKLMRTYYIPTGNNPNQVIIERNKISGTMPPSMFMTLSTNRLAVIKASLFLPSLFSLTHSLALCIIIRIPLRSYHHQIPFRSSHHHSDPAQIGRNLISGTIPAEFGLLRKCTRAEFDNTLISGSIPESVGALTQVTFLIWQPS